MQLGILSASTDPLLMEYSLVHTDDTSSLEDTSSANDTSFLGDTSSLYPQFLHYLTTWYRSRRYSVNDSASSFADAVSINVAVAMWDDVSVVCLQSTSMPFQEYIDYKITVCTSEIQLHHTLKHTPTVMVDLDCNGKL